MRVVRLGDFYRSFGVWPTEGHQLCMPRVHYVSILLYRAFSIACPASTIAAVGIVTLRTMRTSSTRPGVTLSRLSFVVASLSFVLLFWNYGLPQYSPTSRFSRRGEKSTPAPFFIPATSSNSYAAATTYPEKRHRDIYVGRNQFPRKFSFPNFSRSL